MYEKAGYIYKELNEEYTEEYIARIQTMADVLFKRKDIGLATQMISHGIQKADPEHEFNQSSAP